MRLLCLVYLATGVWWLGSEIIGAKDLEAVGDMGLLILVH